MNLTHSQKNQLKKNIHELSLSQLSRKTSIPETEIINYLKEKWPKDRLNKYLQRKSPSENSSPLSPSLQPSKISSFLKENKWQITILITLVLICYVNSLGAEFLSDDNGITQSDKFHTLQNVFTNPFAFFYPLVTFFTYKIFGLIPFFYRIINILFHLGNVLLLYTLLRLLVNKQTALIAGILGAVHPLLVESVTWISGGPHNWYSFFFLLSLLLYYLSSQNQKLYYFSLLAFILSVSTNIKAVSLCLSFFIFEMLCLKRNWKKTLPFFLISLVWILSSFGPFSQRVETLTTQNYEKVGFVNPLKQIPLSISSYFSLIAYPHNLTLYHSEVDTTGKGYFISIIVFILYIIALAAAFKKNKLIFFFLTLFFISLIPNLTPVLIAWLVAERYAYLSSLAIFAVIAILLAKIISRKNLRPFAISIFTAVVFLLIIRTIMRNVDWQTQDNLWTATLKTSPSDPKTHNNMGDVYARHNNLALAAQEFQLAIKLNPNYGDAYHNLGNTYQKMGKEKEAIYNYQKAYQINPLLWQSLQNLAVIYFNKKDYKTAQKYLEQAIKILPQSEILHLNLGLIYLNLGEKGKASEEMKTVLTLNPQNLTAKKFLNDEILGK